MDSSTRPEKFNRTTLLVIACIVLIVVHAFRKDIQIDAITVSLLTLCMIPVIQKYVTSIKASGVELSFREYSRPKQLYIFLDAIASQQRWTFYKPRNGEENMGQGLAVIVRNLYKTNEAELATQLKKWLDDDNKYLKWFAAEVVGFLEIAALKTTLEHLTDKIDITQKLKHWQLNCLWACARMNDYDNFVRILARNDIHPFNEDWILTACLQMKEAEAKQLEHCNLKGDKVAVDKAAHRIVVLKSIEEMVPKEKIEKAVHNISKADVGG